MASMHHSICSEQISHFVDQFYRRVFASEVLGPVFAEQTTQEWDHHLDKMKSFWRSVLLKSGEYKGKPVPVHNRLVGVASRHFDEWLWLFSETSSEVFSEEAVPLVNAAAMRIATSLWLARSADPFSTPPSWKVSADQRIVRSPETERKMMP